MKTIDIIIKEIKTCGKSRYVIARDTGVEPAVLCRVLKGKSMMLETADTLLKYFGYEVKKKERR